MPRTLPMANGRLHVNFDHQYRVRDIYHLHLGLNNQTGGVPWRLGVWVDGTLSWVQDEGWRRELRYEAHDSPVTEARLTHEELGIELVVNDAVAPDMDAFVRKFRITNHAGHERDVRLFLSSRFRIEDNADSVAVFYAPDRRAMFHYKAEHWFCERGMTEGAEVAGVGQFICGEACAHGSWGTWQDAEDGWLEGAAVAQGEADATIGFGAAGEFGARLGAGQTATIYYWLVAGSTHSEVCELDERVMNEGVERIIERAREAARNFFAPARRDFDALPQTHVAHLYHRSLLTLAALADEGGGVVAASDSDERYGYVWPRDGALVANALDRAGLPAIPRRFFRFVAEAARERPWLWQKFNADGTLGASWHAWLIDGQPALPVQEDETGVTLWALTEHWRLHADGDLVAEVYDSLVKRGADWMVEYRDEGTKLPLPSWDLWEERRGVHLWTCAAVVGGLRGASLLAEARGQNEDAVRWRTVADEIVTAIDRYFWRDDLQRYVRSIEIDEDGEIKTDETLDASMCGIFLLNCKAADDPRVAATVEALRDKLRVQTETGGLARYEGDVYQQVERNGDGRVPGNPWFVCSLWATQAAIANARTREELAATREAIDWSCARGDAAKILAEQINPDTGEPLSVAPLAWSHAELVRTIIAYLDKDAELSSRRVEDELPEPATVSR